jgi:ribonuclease PH
MELLYFALGFLSMVLFSFIGGAVWGLVKVIKIQRQIDVIKKNDEKEFDHLHQRIDKDPLKPNGRNLEIQRLISRSLRFAIDLKLLGERQITIDCDVIQADGSTRCASITGGFVALSLAIRKLLRDRVIEYNPLINEVCAISCGIYNNQIIADLDYLEDSKCEVDCNFVLNKNYDLIEIQGTAETGSMTFKQMSEMYELAKKSAEKILQIQRIALQ